MDKIEKIRHGRERQWVKCGDCSKPFYYDYVPYGLANPIKSMPCGHRFEDSEQITADEAIILFSTREE